MAKKFYWLKLNDNFFDREEIKVLEQMPNGKDYVIFYMKLLLKSIKTSGQLRFRDVIPYTPDILASITGTNIDTVRVAIDLFIKLGLMEMWDDGTLFMNETQNMIGSETDSAQRKREQRSREKEAKLLTCDNVTECPEESQKSHIEIDIEKEIDINNMCASSDAHVRNKTKIDYTKDFEEFWDIYPRKKEKQKAYKCWNMLIKAKVPLDDLMKAVKKYDKECKGKEEKYIKLAATFLGANKPYEDYIYESDKKDEFRSFNPAHREL